MSQHPSAVSCDDSDLVLEETCVMDISPGEEGGEEGNLELRHSAVFVRQGGSVLVQVRPLLYLKERTSSLTQ